MVSDRKQEAAKQHEKLYVFSVLFPLAIRRGFKASEEAMLSLPKSDEATLVKNAKKWIAENSTQRGIGTHTIHELYMPEEDYKNKYCKTTYLGGIDVINFVKENDACDPTLQQSSAPSLASASFIAKSSASRAATPTPTPTPTPTQTESTEDHFFNPFFPDIY